MIEHVTDVGRFCTGVIICDGELVHSHLQHISWEVASIG